MAAILGNQVRNLFMIANRAILANNVKRLKNGKSNEFMIPLDRLINSLGGNSSNLTCSGQTVPDNDPIRGSILLKFKY